MMASSPATSPAQSSSLEIDPLGDDAAPVPAANGVLQERAQIGQIMVGAKLLSDEQVGSVLSLQRQRGLRFGDAAVALGYAGRNDVLWALSQQFDYQYAPAAAADKYPELVAASEPFSDRVEAFRDLRSHLLTTVFAAPEGRRSAVAIVSADVGDGKTFIAANLAVAFSQLPGRTLLVDTDMRSPRLHTVFGMPDAVHGLSSLLSGRASTPAFVRPIAALPDLHVLPVGAVPPNPAELIQQQRFHLLMDRLGEEFDHVIVDTPAAAHGSDARLIATRAGAALLVSRRHQTRAKAAQKLVAQLNKTGITMAGVVMNDY